MYPEHMDRSASMDRESQIRRGRRLEYFTIIYNCLEGIVSIVAGLIAGSISLIGFGIDSVIEVTSGTALLWRLHNDTDPARREASERLTLRIVGVCFIALSVYILYDSGSMLIYHEVPDPSIPGIIIAVVSVIVMPFLAKCKRQVAANINSAAMQADSRQTDFCAYLSAILLCGLLLNAFLGWWWADPVAAIVMIPIIASEGIKALRGKTCCESCGCSS